MATDLLEVLLEQRGILLEQREGFLRPDYERDTHDPFLLSDTQKAVTRITKAIDGNERIAVYADFDCDGIPGAVVLHDVFKKIGHDNTRIYIPHRHDEGYGFHQDAVDTLLAEGVSLIITVDVGCAAHDTVAYAQDRGIDVIVTDHHELSTPAPEPYALVHPQRAEYPFTGLCGAGVAFKLAQALIAHGRSQSCAWAEEIPEGWEKWLLDMVAIATVADMVPLVDENRALVHFGLLVLRKSRRVGIQALCKKLRVDQRNLTEDDIGFLIAPRINAASRMDCPELGFRLLATDDIKEAESLAAQLQTLNNKRKGVVASLVREARIIAGERFEGVPAAVFGNPEWKPSLLGLVANSVMDGREGIVCVWGRDGKGELKGSCRSDGSVHVAELFAEAKERGALLACGGHECAGGFSVSHEQVHILPEVFGEIAEQKKAHGEARDDAPEAHDMPLAHARIDTYRELTALAPFGVGNPKPLLRMRAVVHSAKLFGKEQQHTEVVLTDPDKRFLVRAFDFFRSPETFSHPPEPGKEVYVVGTLERDAFKGRDAVALRLVDIVARA